MTFVIFEKTLFSSCRCEIFSAKICIYTHIYSPIGKNFVEISYAQLFLQNFLQKLPVDFYSYTWEWHADSRYTNVEISCFYKVSAERKNSLYFRNAVFLTRACSTLLYSKRADATQTPTIFSNSSWFILDFRLNRAVPHHRSRTRSPQPLWRCKFDQAIKWSW